SFFELPLRWAGIEPKTILRFKSIGGPLMAAISVAFYTGLCVALPVLLYFLGEFVLPALTMKEKRFVLPGIGAGFLLFLAGAGFCFFQVMPRMIKWMYAFGEELNVSSLY